MSHIKPLSETPESAANQPRGLRCHARRTSEDAEDRVAVLEDCLLDMKPEQNRYLLSMADTMRIIDGASPIAVLAGEAGANAGGIGGRGWFVG